MQGWEQLFSFYRGKRVLVTGHTGFKGAWLCHLLKAMGAEVVGYAQTPPTTPSLFELDKTECGMHSVIGDVRDFDTLYATFCKAEPQIVFHLAAQPIVREGYRLPVETFSVNLMGTVNVLECMRRFSCVRSAVMVTTDKVYAQTALACAEQDALGGQDPYAGSKACAELAVQSYRNAYFSEGTPAISTVRAGNVIGGGDFAPDRIIPDCVRAVLTGQTLLLRNPHATRPYQHVLEALTAYLSLAAQQYHTPALSGSYNIGPLPENSVSTGELASMFAQCYGGVSVAGGNGDGPREAAHLRLDVRLARERLGVVPVWPLSTAVEKVVEWTRCYAEGGDISAVMDAQISEFLHSADKE